MPTVEERFRATVEALKEIKQDFYRLTLSQEDTSLMDSKVGGLPYLPEETSIPLAEDGTTPLRFLAQINLGHLIGGLIPHATGILQFWIQDDDFYGMDVEDISSQKQSRVVFYPRVKPCLSVSEVKELYPSLLSTVEKSLPIQPEVCFKITANKGSCALSITDFHHDLYFVEKHNALFPDKPISDILDLLVQVEDEVSDILFDQEAGHKMLGFADFTQDDPRSNDFNEHILLFQLDSEFVGEEEILWGDCGVGNWFILPEDLEKGDFSKVLYHWDCC